MAKVPVMGRVKTRLAAAVGAVEATRFYRHTVSTVVGRLARDRRWTTEIAVAPDAGRYWTGWRQGPVTRAQGGGDLGRRMQRIIDRTPAGPVIIVGTDIPAIRPDHISAAFRLVRGTGAVLGAAPDGGYWLVGLRGTPRRLRPFARVRWSTAHAHRDTAANLDPLTVAAAATLSDVDDGAALAACRGWFGRRVLPVDVPRQCGDSG